MAKNKRWTQEQLIEAVKTSFSIAETLRKLGLKPVGGNYNVINGNIKRLNLDISHFTGMLWSKGKRLGYKKRLEEYLIIYDKDTHVSTHVIRKRLIKESYKEHKCEMCGLTHWKNSLIPLELHHIDGNRYNCLLENLQVICPNCHALTSNYRGKNTAQSQKNRFRIKKTRIVNNYFCIKCSKLLKGKCKTGMCQKCYKISLRTVDRPSREYLLNLLQDNNYEAVGRMYGVTGNAIRKWLKSEN